MSAAYPIRVLAVLTALTLCQVADSQEPKLAELLERSPSPANAIAYTHFPSLLKLMADAKMQSQLTERVEEVWLVSELDTGSLTPRWEAGYGKLKRKITVNDLATAVGGYVDEIADREVVWTPRQSYLVPVGDQSIGFLRPANRSVLAQWLDPSINVNYSGYLVEQAKQPESYLSLMIAVDLKDAFSPLPIEDRIADFQSLKSQSPKTVASILASVKGISIIIGRRSLAECILTVEFEKSPASLVPIANQLLGEILDRNGTAAPEVLSWKVKVDGGRLSFQGPILEESLLGLIGIFTLHGEAAGVASSLGDRVTLSKSASDQTAYITKNYFDQVLTVIERVRKNQAQTTGSRAKWNDQQARRIDEMGTLNVDPQIVDYGFQVANLLRGDAQTIRSVNISAGQQKAREGAYRGPTYYGGYYSGYYGGYAAAANQRVTSAVARGNAYADYTQTLTTIDKMTADIRRAMTEKYKIQF